MRETPAKQRLDFRAIDQQYEQRYGSPGESSEKFLKSARDMLVSVLTQYGQNLHPDDERALRCAIEGLSYLLTPPTVEVVTTNKGPFTFPAKEHR